MSMKRHHGIWYVKRSGKWIAVGTLHDAVYHP